MRFLLAVLLIVFVYAGDAGADFALSGGGSSIATGSTDNAILRADGTAGSTSQGSTVTLGDTGAISNVLGADVIGLNIKGSVGQSANLQNWTNSSNTVVASMSPAGNLTSTAFTTNSGIVLSTHYLGIGNNHRLYVNLVGDNTLPMFDFTDAAGNLGITYYSSLVRLNNTSADLPVLNIRGAGSQTANLLNFQTSVPATLLSVTSNGSILGAGAQTVSGMLQKQVTSTTTTLTIAQCGSTIVNDSTDVLTLPEASTALGCRYTFVVANASNFDINPNDATDLILPFHLYESTAIAPSAGDAIRSATLGASITIEAVGANAWAVISVVDTWADVN